MALGGAGGALARYGVGGWIHGLTGAAFPWGTLTVNVVGCFALGLAMPLLEASLAVSLDLSIVIEVVDEESRIQNVLPMLDEMIGGGLITLERARVVLYRPADANAEAEAVSPDSGAR